MTISTATSTAQQVIDPLTYPFPSLPYWIYLRQLFQAHGWKALSKQFRYPYRRPFSRALIKRHAPEGYGIEIGVGAFSVAPLERTVLTDAFQNHGTSLSIARFFCPADSIPANNGSFQFVVSEHVLEHLANPIAAIEEWKRILVPGGRVLIWLPHRDRTFDRERPRTPLNHLEKDYRAGITDPDFTHFAEWKEQVMDRGLAPHYHAVPVNEHPHRGILHHHVWIAEDICELFESRGLRILEQHNLCPDRTDSFAVVAERT